MASPINELRKLLKETKRFKRSQQWFKQRPRLKYFGKSARKDLVEQLGKQWRGGYVCLETGEYLYVPAKPDQQGLRRLSETFTPDPAIGLIVGPGDVVFDIGANIGEWSLPACSRAGRDGKVIAFEPIPEMAAAIAKSFKVNGFDQGHVVEAAMSDQAGETTFTVCSGEDGSGDTALSHIGEEGPSGKRLKVACLTVDDFVAEQKFEKLDCLKIDVEGWELSVLKGAAETLRSLKPKLVFETGHETPEGRKDTATYLEMVGYDLIGVLLDESIIEANWKDYVAEQGPLSFGQTHNLLALPK